MRKILLILSATVLMLFSLTAQSQEIKFGIKGGYGLSYLKTENVDLDSKAGFHAGGLVEFKFTKRFSLQPEVCYSQQGVQKIWSEWTYEYVETWSLTI